VSGEASQTTRLGGVGVTPVTPFNDDLGAVDTAGLRANIEFLIDSGIELVYPAGNTGESMSLSVSEWTEIVETSVSVADGSAAVFPGIGHDYPTALELARRAGSLGADGLLLMPRSQPHATSAGIAAYWRGIIEASGLPVVVYKRDLPDQGDLAQLVSEEVVVACKYADRDLSAFARVVATNASSIVWTCGLAERYAPFYWQAGARGFTSGLANFAPGLALRMHAALLAGDQTGAMTVRAECLPFEELRARQGDAFNVSAVKTAMDSLGLAGGKVRPPLVDLDEDASRQARDLARSMTMLGS